MFLAIVFCIPMISEATLLYDRRNLGITNLSQEIIPVNTTKANYKNNQITIVTDDIFKNFPFMDRIVLWENEINW